MTSARAFERSFAAIAATLFVASAAGTIVWCRSMSAMGGMPMPGGWTMSMTWMRMPGQSWPGMAATFLGMWMVMMVAMMLPALIPMLRPERDRRGLTSIVALAYFFVWAAIGVAVFALGVALATLEMREPALARAVPIAAGILVLLAGAYQFTKRKAHALACCREMRRLSLPAGARSAWRHGLHLGLHCARCCGNLMLILLVVDVMDLRVMAAVTAAITAERIAPAGTRVARGVGAIAIAAGVFRIARAW